MRHGKKINHLGRTYSHRQALLSNMAASLILHKRINTTVAKAKALRKYVEPIITRSKDDNTHARRVVFSYLQNKFAVAELFREVAPKIADRPGGYTRIIKLENRPGDNADMCMMELVDFNLIYGGEGKEGGAKKAKTTRRGRSKKTTASEAEAGESSESASENQKIKAPAKKSKKKSDS
jgi:large subunit ribosomal protein L17